MRFTPLSAALARCLCVVWLACGCASEQPNDSVETRQQPLPGFMGPPETTGLNTGSRLGAAVAGCKESIIAGAPGDNATLYRPADGGKAWLVGDGGVAGRLGLAVGCEASTDVDVLTGGSDRAIAFRPDQTTATFVPVAGATRALAIHPSSKVVLLGDGARSLVELKTFGTGTGSSLQTLYGDGGTAGIAVAWSPQGDRFATRDSAQGKVRLYGWNGTAATLRIDQPLIPPGVALVLGDVHPRPGVEVIVGAPGVDQVRIYGEDNGTLRELMVLRPPVMGTQGTFGAALAVQPTAGPAGLQYLWVGDPGNDRVFRFLGDAGQSLSPALPGLQDFGFALAFNDNALIIGAPTYSDTKSNQGAVYGYPLPEPEILGTVTAMACTLGVPCPQCAGICIGGVLCNSFGATQVCDAGVLDAGEADAGEADAGEADAGEADAGEADAGEADAGEADAGEVDAGEVDGGAGAVDAGAPDGGAAKDAGTGTAEFKAGCQGCAGVGGGPWLLLALGLTRRRRPV